MFLAGLRSTAADTNLLPPAGRIAPPIAGTNEKSVSPRPDVVPIRAENTSPAARAAEQNRADLEAAARRNINLIAGQLSELEQAYKRELLRVRDSGPFSDRTMWIIVAGLATLSLLLALGFGWAHRNALRRLTDEVQDLRVRADVMSEEIQEQQEQAPPAPRRSSSAQKARAMDEEGPPAREVDAADDLVRKRLAPVLAAMPDNGGPEKKAPISTPSISPAPAGEIDAKTHLELVLGKAQTYVNLGQMEPALACYDEALALTPQQAETLVKKGKTLEQLERLDLAIESYDRAIAADPSMATAFLLKAGVLNRLGRYGEALKCYDLALRTRHSNLAA